MVVDASAFRGNELKENKKKIFVAIINVLCFEKIIPRQH